MDTGQDIQATGATRGLPIASPLRTSPRPQPHQGGGGQQTPLCAMYVHSPCAVRFLRHDPTARWTASRTCRLPGPPGDSPSPACHGPHHALNRTGVAADRLPLCAPCRSTVPVQCGACAMTPPRHGHRAGYAGYPCHPRTAHHQSATDHTTPLTAPGGLLPAACAPHVCPQSLCTAVRLPPLHALATPRIICYAGNICVHRLTLQSLCVSERDRE
jgi:hypothetical protein